MPARPINPYGISKRMVEQILEWYGSAYGVQYGILRYFNACGATEERGEDHHPESHLIPNILMAAAGERERILVFGDDYDTPDGTCVRDYIHVADLAEAHLLAMNHLRKSGESVVANLGNAVGNSVLEVIETVKRVTGRDFEVTRAPRRPGDAARLVASSSKARALLGWQPEKGDIESIVRDAWQWRQARPHGYAR
jgi:UDP-glucose 4-epimerase